MRPSLLIAALLLVPAAARADHVDAPKSDHANDFFGQTLALDGDTLAVGVLGANARGFDAGRVHVYVHEDGQWRLEALLDNPGEVPAYGNFGVALALDGDTLAVGATGADGHAIGEYAQRGAVHVYTRGSEGWRLQASFDDPDTDSDAFGRVVRLHGDTLAIAGDGRVRDRESLPRQIRIFRRDGDEWAEEGRISLSQAYYSELALGDGTLFVRSWEDPAILAFRREDGVWSEEPLPAIEDVGRFLIDGDTALIESSSDIGTVVLRDRDGAWTQEGILPGFVSALAGDFAAESETEWDIEGGEVSRVHRWQRVDGVWTPLADVFEPEDVPGTYPEFGWGLAINERWVAVGSPRAGWPDHVQSGVVDVFANTEAAPRVARFAPDDELDEGCGCRSGGPGGLLAGLLALGRRRRRTR